MLRGLYTAGLGMITEAERTDVIANNVANVNTAGYKRDEAISREFEELMLRRINDKTDKPEVARLSKSAEALLERGLLNGQVAPEIGGLGRGALVDEIATIREQGSFKQTDNQLDVAIAGNGYFVIETPQGDRYTRNGSFLKSANNELVTVDGQRVLGQDGRPIILPEGTAKVTITEQGQVRADNNIVGTLGLVDFADRRALLKQGNNLYMVQANQQPEPATGTIVQGSLEMSNVNTVSEMVKLINAYRTYEANSKAVVSQDNLLDKAVNEVGRV